MKIEFKYELPIFSQSLKENPSIKREGLNISIELIGWDENNVLRKVEIRFISVISYKITLTCFSLILYDSYDKLVELKESEWLQELKHVNEEKFNDWNPRHFAIYLYEDAMYQFIAKECEVIEYEKMDRIE